MLHDYKPNNLMKTTIKIRDSSCVLETCLHFRLRIMAMLLIVPQGNKLCGTLHTKYKPKYFIFFQVCRVTFNWNSPFPVFFLSVGVVSILINLHQYSINIKDLSIHQYRDLRQHHHPPAPMDY